MSRKIRHKRLRKKISGTADKPRLCVFRSNKHTYAQLIDDQKAEVMLSTNDFGMKGTKKERAFKVGQSIAKEAKVKKVVFDRAGYKFHGRVKAVAEGAREGGLKF